jgi:Zn finger protein HypA/HybF involved in hydrogenase expression
MRRVGHGSSSTVVFITFRGGDQVHELSIAVSLVEIACEEVRLRELPRVQAVHLRIGARSGVVKEALTFSFAIAADGTAIAGAELRFEDTAGTELELRALEVVD